MELRTFNDFMSNDDNWIIFSSGRYMFVRFIVDYVHSSKGFFAKINYGKVLFCVYFDVVLLDQVRNEAEGEEGIAPERKEEGEGKWDGGPG